MDQRTSVSICVVQGRLCLQTAKLTLQLFRVISDTAGQAQGERVQKIPLMSHQDEVVTSKALNLLRRRQPSHSSRSKRTGYSETQR